MQLWLQITFKSQSLERVPFYVRLAQKVGDRFAEIRNFFKPERIQNSIFHLPQAICYAAEGQPSLLLWNVYYFTANNSRYISTEKEVMHTRSMSLSYLLEHMLGRKKLRIPFLVYKLFLHFTLKQACPIGCLARVVRTWC